MGIEPPSTKEVLLDAVEQTVGAEVLKTVEPDPAPPVYDDVGGDSNEVADDGVPVCITQQITPGPLANGPSDIIVGFENEVPRWVPGSVIKWAAWRMGFESQADANYAALQLDKACQAWNEKEVGVTFKWVPLAKDANFVLFNGGAQGRLLASAFFPNRNDLNFMRVYRHAFTPAWKRNMWQVFTHELGHVLGLRHEFALNPVNENPGQGLVLREAANGAVLVGDRNEYSVMNYRAEPPVIQESDVVSTREFYAQNYDADGNPPRIGLTEIIDYTPR